MPQPLISIIIPIYNAEKYLEPCLKSVSSLAYENFQVLMINDGSTDRTEEICYSYSRKDNRFEYYTHENRGEGFTRNRGFRLSKGEYVLCLDADDCIHSQVINGCLKLMLANEADIVIYKYQKFQKTYEDIGSYSGKYRVLSRQQALKEMFKGELYRGLCCNKMYKADIVKAAQFPDDRRYGMDSLFTYRALNRAKKVIYTPDVFYFYRNTPSSVLNEKITLDRLQIIETYIEIVEDLRQKRDNYLLSYGYLGLHDRFFELCSQLEGYNREMLEGLYRRTRNYINDLVRLSGTTRFQKVLYRVFRLNPRLFFALYRMKKA